MTRATLSEVLQPALQRGHAVPGFVCLGWEDARAFTMAAEETGLAVILQAGPGCRAHTPLPVIAAMFRHLADSVSVPVVLHLDHGRSVEEAREAIGEGFTSVMFDGSTLPLEENIRQTTEVARLAHAAGASCEGEVGFVGYAGGAASARTDPEEAARFARETGVDAMAVAVGNVHLQEAPGGHIDEAAVRAIAAATRGAVPLVIHGGSGVPPDQRARLARATPICKLNIGTELRQTFGAALRKALHDQPGEFDRLKLLGPTEAPMAAQAARILRELAR
ncbi:class II fructose-bisphosphate aldolase [Frigidibacter sp. RF13]|uniref:class II fructose-bisphosphate aldolase n=1 Tax=Frigidibacter sp. RF13 TaxID=2997340 RepID=UPI00226F493C|nr:class II fructose-bisphosphate aldolase [Frigidibacter sp. RF13]MCY1127970.1 class II fructose-bisphosphate aldolase [Frigidibacter sp. RF13]